MCHVRTEQSNSESAYNQWANSIDYATNYCSDISNDPNSRLKNSLARKYCRPGFDVLDVGCANGIHMSLLAGYCRNITGIDINDKMLHLAQSNHTKKGIVNVHFERQSATNIEFPDSSFDMVYSFSTLLLVFEINMALSEMVRVLRPGGTVIIEVVGRLNLSRIYWERYYKKNGCFGIHSFYYQHILHKINELGLEFLESHATGFTDQLKYIPGVRLWKSLGNLFNGKEEINLDYRISNNKILFPFANRWYIVCRKKSSPP